MPNEENDSINQNAPLLFAANRTAAAQTPLQTKIALVLLLNLIPHTGLGVLVGAGFRALPYLFFFWVLESLLRVPNNANMYLILSMIGVGCAVVRHIASQTDDVEDLATPLETLSSAKVPDFNVDAGTPVALRISKNGTRVAALPTFESKLKRAEGMLRDSWKEHHDADVDVIARAPAAQPVPQAAPVSQTQTPAGAPPLAMAVVGAASNIAPNAAAGAASKSSAQESLDLDQAIDLSDGEFNSEMPDMPGDLGQFGSDLGVIPILGGMPVVAGATTDFGVSSYLTPGFDTLGSLGNFGMNLGVTPAGFNPAPVDSPTAADPGKKLCPKCGADLHGQFSFCLSCLSPL